MIGIYKITNLINQKVYIGQSWNIKHRWVEHKSNAKTGKNNGHLYNALLKYGVENFSFEVLKEFTTEYPEVLLQKHLDRIESMFIKYFDSTNRKKGYNKKSGGSHGKHCEETIKKLSGENHYLYGKHPSKETVDKRSGENNYLYGKHLPEETKIKMSEGKTKPIKCIELNKIFPSQKQAEVELKIANSSISAVCSGKRKTAGGYHFQFVEEDNRQ